MIRHNYLHHIYGFENRGCIGIYLDDMYSGTSIFGNVFDDAPRAASGQSKTGPESPWTKAKILQHASMDAFQLP